MSKMIFVYMLFIILPCAKAPIPGRFFWKPRLSLVFHTVKPKTIAVNYVVVESYQIGLTAVAIGTGYVRRERITDLNPLTCQFYSNAWRWALRHMDLVIPWMSGAAGSYVDAHQTWKSRQTYANTLLPSLMQKMLIFISGEKWRKEAEDMKLFHRYAEPEFSKWYIPVEIIDEESGEGSSGFL